MSEVLTPCTETENNAERGRETASADRLIHASFANNYDCDGSGSLCSTAQSKSNKVAMSDKTTQRFYFRFLC